MSDQEGYKEVYKETNVTIESPLLDEEVQEDKATWIEYLNWKRCGIMRIIELGADPKEHEAELNALNAILNRSEL